MQTSLMTLPSSYGFRRELPYKRKLLFITSPDTPQNEEIRATIKEVMLNLLEPVEFKEIDINKHPGVAKKYNLKTLKTFTRHNLDRKEGESMLDLVRRNEPVESETLALPLLVFLEDDVVCYQKQGIVRPYTLWAAMTRKPVYSQPADDVVPVNPFA